MSVQKQYKASNNEIESLPDTISIFWRTHLQEVDFSENCLKELPSYIFELEVSVIRWIRWGKKSSISPNQSEQKNLWWELLIVIDITPLWKSTTSISASQSSNTHKLSATYSTVFSSESQGLVQNWCSSLLLSSSRSINTTSPSQSDRSEEASWKRGKTSSQLWLRFPKNRLSRRMCNMQQVSRWQHCYRIVCVAHKEETKKYFRKFASAICQNSLLKLYVFFYSYVRED